MQRVIVFGKSKKRTRKVAHITRAFKDQGCETLWINPAKVSRWKRDRAEDHILSQVCSFVPDIVFIFSQDIPIAVLEKIANTSIKTVLFYVDWKPRIPESLLERARLVDYFLVTSRGLLDEYRREGVKNPVYFLDACDRYEHRRRSPLLPLWKSDLSFIGAARADEPRVSLIRRCREICDVKVYGRGWEDFGIKPMLKSVGPRGYGLICGGSKIMLGADITSETNGYWSNRLWLTLGSGGFFLTNYVPGMEEVFTNREHLVWYRDEEECISLVREYLDKPEERKRIADTGYRYVHEHHTFHHFAGRVLALCNAR